jgi:hypothetical protein
LFHLSLANVQAWTIAKLMELDEWNHIPALCTALALLEAVISRCGYFPRAEEFLIATIAHP